MLKRAPCSSLRLPCTFGVLPGLGRDGRDVFLLIVRSSSPVWGGWIHNSERRAKAESSLSYKSFMLSQSCASQTSIISSFQLNRSFTLLNSGSATVFYPVLLIFCQTHNEWLISVCCKGCNYLFLLPVIKYMLFDLIVQHLYLDFFCHFICFILWTHLKSCTVTLENVIFPLLSPHL